MAPMVRAAALAAAASAAASAAPAAAADYHACVAAGGREAQISCRALASDLPHDIMAFGTTTLLNDSREWLVTELLVRRRGGACDGVAGRSGFLPYPGHRAAEHPSHARLDPQQISTLVWDFTGCDKVRTLSEIAGHDFDVEVVVLRGVPAIDLSGLALIEGALPPWLRNAPAE